MLAPVAEWLETLGVTPFMLRVIAQLTVIGVVFMALQISAAVLVYMERKVAAFVQQRYGPYLVGPYGLLQPIADIVKLIMKEELRPKSADAILFYAAPILSATAAFAAFAVVPFGADTTFFGLLAEPIHMAAADVNVGLLVIFAITSMGVYGIVLAGWSSNSKYSLLGSAGIIVMDETTCMVWAAENLLHFYRHESCGKCTPCREGGAWLHQILQKIERGDGQMRDLDLLMSVANNILGKTLCAFGDAAATPVLTTVKTFRAEYEAHIREGRCTVPSPWRSSHRSMAAAH